MGPVRIGNGAYEQLQLDIYGELMDAVYLFNKYGTPISYDLWMNLRRLLNWVCDHWQEPDDGIWEVPTGSSDSLTGSRMVQPQGSEAAAMTHWAKSGLSEKPFPAAIFQAGWGGPMRTHLLANSQTHCASESSCLPA